MIVKKKPILQGFPDFDSVKKLSKSVSFVCGNAPVFYDIETTGLSRYSTFLYLIGALVQENNNWFLYQWMSENEKEEVKILCEFFDFLKHATATIQYNGKRFDQPYLEERYKKNNIPSPFENLPTLDLYQELKPCKELLNLSRMKQPDLENFLGLDSRNYCDGGKCIRLYKAYCKKADPVLLETIMGHNKEDLLGLGRIFSMLSYRMLFEGKYEPLEADYYENKQILMKFALPSPIPIPISRKGFDFYFTAKNQKGALMITLTNNRIRQFYSNYKDYDYVPGEDSAIPKVLSRYMDKNLREKARPENCYTWFTCNEEFLKNKDKQRQYLNSTIPCLLKLN